MGGVTGGVLLRPVNITNLFLQNSYIIIMALGMLLVIVAGHIDLSVGAVMGFIGALAAVSVGVVLEETLLDLCYEEDNRADVDFNIVMTDGGALVEVQGAAEGSTFSRGDLDALLNLAEGGIHSLLELQRGAVEAWTQTGAD